MEKYVRVSIRIPEVYVNMLEKIVKSNKFNSRAEAIRYAVNMLISHYKRYV